jgi:type II secretory pathway pseudopilin PulG
VELLVVIVILAMLASLVTPAIMNSLTKARNSAIKAEIDMLHMALMNYQSEYGAVPPCVEPTNYWTTGQYTRGGPAAKHLQRLFPRCGDTAYQLNNVNNPNPPSPNPNPIVQLTQKNALVAWLAGFTPDPINPLLPGSLRVKLYDFERARIDSSTAAYHPSGKKGSPYIYFDAGSYGSLAGLPAQDNRKSFADGGNAYKPEYIKDPSGTATEFFNATTFQILCAGRDEQWGTEDDLSNFWPGTRVEYERSLKN